MSGNVTNDTKIGFGRFLSGSLVGTSFEWYDFYISGTMASLIWPEVFFPTKNFALSLILSFITFGVGFGARPIGSWIFGHFGDKIGRKAVLIQTLLFMGGGTFLIGITPGYATIGVAGGVLLAIFRFLQGLGVGGEFPSVNSWILEIKAKSKFRNLWASSAQLGSPIGLVASSLFITYLLTNTSSSFFASIGWRIPYFVGTALVLVGVIVRYRLTETPIFKYMQTKKKIVKIPSLTLFKESWKKILTVAWLPLGTFAVFFLTLEISVPLITAGGLSKSFATLTITIAGVALLFTVPLFSLLSDKIGRRLAILIPAIWLVIWSYPYFTLMTSGNAALVVLAQLLWVPIATGGIFAINPVILGELFSERYRVSGIGLTYAIPTLVGGIAPPIIFAYFVGLYQGVLHALTAIGSMVLIFNIVSLAAVLGLWKLKLIKPSDQITAEDTSSILSEKVQT
jgi:MFS family permease